MSSPLVTAILEGAILLQQDPASQKALAIVRAAVAEVAEEEAIELQESLIKYIHSEQSCTVHLSKHLCHMKVSSGILKFDDVEDYTEYGQWDDLDSFLDDLNIYRQVRVIEIERDNMIEIPKNISQFTKLHTLSIEGSRLRRVDVSRIPQSVRKLSIHPSYEANLDILRGIHQLPEYLEELEFDGYDEDLDWPPLPKFYHLKKITIRDTVSKDFVSKVLKPWLRKYNNEYTIDEDTSSVSVCFQPYSLDQGIKII